MKLWSNICCPSKGDVREAKKMIAAAAEAGADCVKLQKSYLKVQKYHKHLIPLRISSIRHTKNIS